MKQTLFILLAIIFSTTIGVSQDIITTKTGEDILAKILEISKTEVKYRKFDNQDGPLYTLLKSDILMIRYENGSKEIFHEEKEEKVDPTPPRKFTNPSATQLDMNSPQDQKAFYAAKVEKYKRLKNTGATFTVLGSVLLVVGVVTLSNSSSSSYYNNGYAQTSNTGNAEAGAAAFLFGMAGLGAGIPLWIVGAHNQKKYFMKSEGVSFKFNMTPQNKGLTLTYRF